MFAHGARTTIGEFTGFVGYILNAIHHAMMLCINDPPSELRLALYCDSDFVGCVDTSRSTSGYVLLAVEGPASFALMS